MIASVHPPAVLEALALAAAVAIAFAGVRPGERRRAARRAGDAVAHAVHAVPAQVTVAEAARTVPRADRGAAYAVVEPGGRVAGLLLWDDVLRVRCVDRAGRLVGDLAVPAVVPASATLEDVIRRPAVAAAGCAVVTGDDGAPLGLLDVRAARDALADARRRRRAARPARSTTPSTRSTPS